VTLRNVLVKNFKDLNYLLLLIKRKSLKDLCYLLLEKNKPLFKTFNMQKNMEFVL